VASTDPYKPVTWGTPGMIRLIPESLDKEYKRPAPTLPRVSSHWLDWVDSAKAGRQAGSHFEFGARLSEIALLGNIACRQKGKILHYDAKKGKFMNNDEANALLSRPYREGWKLPA
jgi:hypothetical protein